MRIESVNCSFQEVGLFMALDLIDILQQADPTSNQESRADNVLYSGSSYVLDTSLGVGGEEAIVWEKYYR